MDSNFDTVDSSPSAKGIKAGVNVTIEGGIIDIDSSDDSIHSNNSLTIYGGDITLASGDDGIHSDTTLEINGGDISITQSYEGIESSVITINDGSIHLIAGDDGINATGGVDGSSMNGWPGQNSFNYSGNCYLYINGGYIVIDATGDGIDINGSIDMTAGFIISNGLPATITALWIIWVILKLPAILWWLRAAPAWRRPPAYHQPNIR